MSFIDDIKQKAKAEKKTIVLPESTDIRTLEATEMVLKEGYADIILVGNETEITKIAKEHNLSIEGAKIVNPLTANKKEEYVEYFYELRKNKGITLEDAKRMLEDEVYFGMMMVKSGDADGLVSGACHSTSDTLRPALQILKTAPGTKLVSAFFLMVVPDCSYGDRKSVV